jgi:sulfatase maturation enzyme AslB (radical SAM superfamily)
MKQDLHYCPLAWGSTAIRNNGDYRICCHANVSENNGLLRDESGELLNVTKHSPEAVRNNLLLKEVRKTFLNGNWPAVCGRCKTEEESGLKSGRTHAIARLKASDFEEEFVNRVELTAQDGSIPDDFPLTVMDIRFGNLCNLRCRSCGPTDSSSWYREWREVENISFSDSGITVQLENSEGRVVANPDRFSWHEKIEAQMLVPADPSRLRRIYLAGGEPLLIPMHLNFLKELEKQEISKNIYLEYNSNLTYLPAAVLDSWQKFRAVGVGVSMDGFGKFHEYLRFPAKQSVMDKNLDLLDLQPKNVFAWFACTVSWMNASHLPDFLAWILSRNFQKVGKRADRLPISFHLLHKPNYMNLREVPMDGKRLIEDRIKKGWDKIRGHFSESQRKSGDDAFRGILHYMNSSNGNSDWQMILDRNYRLDLLRKKFFSDIDPELAEALAYPKYPTVEKATDSIFV